MGKKMKSKTIGNVIELDLPPSPPPEPGQSLVKKKKELSDKQRENLSKGMAILKAKREAKSRQSQKEDVETEPTPPPVVAPPVVQAPVVQAPVVAPEQPDKVSKIQKERKPRVVKNYLTTEDFNSFKTELLTSLKPAVSSVPSIPEYKPIAQPVAQTILKERVISGSELLNKIFFK